MAEERDKKEPASWKINERDVFLSLLLKKEVSTLLDIGAGTGAYGKFFNDYGIEVVCTDLSPENVKLCKAKGLTAHVMDFLNLEFPPGSFEAIFAMNCLLHVPRGTLPGILESLHDLLKPGGVFYLGQYGGVDFEGIYPDDPYKPKRYYSILTDEGLTELVTVLFEVQFFNQVTFSGDDLHFQSMILKRN
jgi:SAM-dependent methyltransferase